MIEKFISAVIIFFMGTTAIPSKLPVKKIIPQINNSTKSIFVPSWMANAPISDDVYSGYYLFGIVPNDDGTIDQKALDAQWKNMSSISDKKKYITLQLHEQKSILGYLEDGKRQSILTNSVNSYLSSHNAQGVVLDLELSFTTNTQREGQISQFVQTLCTGVQKNYRTCFVAVYGDSFYRSRPYDIKKIGEVADRVLIMAYDFHKAGGEPGPNYSFDERQKYGYDFKQMITDFAAVVPKEKIEVIYGMYGYDWTMNDQGTPLKSAQALSLNNIKRINTGEKPQMTGYKLQKNTAFEKNIQYLDQDGRSHIVWYEDEESVAVKTRYLQQMGISQVSFWAWSYF
jgi:spore germination protein YaaH